MKYRLLMGLAVFALLPQFAAAEMDEATIMMIQQQQAESYRRQAQQDREDFGIIQQWSAKMFGGEYARQYGDKQASAMFGVPIHTQRAPQRQRARLAAKRNLSLAAAKPAAPASVLWLGVPKPAAQDSATPASAAIEARAMNAIAPSTNTAAPLPPETVAQAAPAPLPAQNVSQASVTPPPATPRPKIHKRYDPDANPDEEAWQRAHGRH